jgi:hypothetical protein
MAQAAHNTAAADAFSPGDLKTAELFGRNFAESVARIGFQSQKTLGLVA